MKKAHLILMFANDMNLIANTKDNLHHSLTIIKKELLTINIKIKEKKNSDNCKYKRNSENRLNTLIL